MAIDRNKVTKQVNLDLSKVPENKREDIKREVGFIIIDRINEHLNRSESPVKNGLYKKQLADGDKSRLLDTGDMRSEIEFKTNAQGVEVGVFDSGETDKAYAHNTGFDGHPFLSGKGLERQFIPAPGVDFKDEIEREVKDVVDKVKINDVAQIIKQLGFSLTESEAEAVQLEALTLADFILGKL